MVEGKRTTRNARAVAIAAGPSSAPPQEEGNPPPPDAGIRGTAPLEIQDPPGSRKRTQTPRKKNTPRKKTAAPAPPVRLPTPPEDESTDTSGTASTTSSDEDTLSEDDRDWRRKGKNKTKQRTSRRRRDSSPSRRRTKRKQGKSRRSRRTPSTSSRSSESSEDDRPKKKRNNRTSSTSSNSSESSEGDQPKKKRNRRYSSSSSDSSSTDPEYHREKYRSRPSRKARSIADKEWAQIEKKRKSEIPLDAGSLYKDYPTYQANLGPFDGWYQDFVDAARRFGATPSTTLQRLRAKLDAGGQTVLATTKGLTYKKRIRELKRYYIEEAQGVEKRLHLSDHLKRKPGQTIRSFAREVKAETDKAYATGTSLSGRYQLARMHLQNGVSRDLRADLHAINASSWEEFLEEAEFMDRRRPPHYRHHRDYAPPPQRVRAVGCEDYKTEDRGESPNQPPKDHRNKRGRNKKRNGSRRDSSSSASPSYRRARRESPRRKEKEQVAQELRQLRESVSAITEKNHPLPPPIPIPAPIATNPPIVPPTPVPTPHYPPRVRTCPRCRRLASEQNPCDCTRCYRCNLKGHYARDCRLRADGGRNRFVGDRPARQPDSYPIRRTEPYPRAPRDGHRNDRQNRGRGPQPPSGKQNQPRSQSQQNTKND